MTVPIKWFTGLAIKDARDPILKAHREGRLEEVDAIELGGSVHFIPVPEELPDGLWWRDGKLMYECGSCGQPSEWPVEIEDFELGHYANVCGGSPRCIP